MPLDRVARPLGLSTVIAWTGSEQYTYGRPLGILAMYSTIIDQPTILILKEEVVRIPPLIMVVQFTNIF
jgi:hypothetical protein